MKNFNQITLNHRRSAPQASNDEWLARRRRQLMAIHPDADVPLQREKQHTMHRSAMQQAAKPFTPWCVKKEHILAKCHNN